MNGYTIAAGARELLLDALGVVVDGATRDPWLAALAGAALVLWLWKR